MSWPSSAPLMLGYEGTSDGSRRRRYGPPNEDSYLPPHRRRKLSLLTMSTAASEIPSPTLLSERLEQIEQQQIAQQQIAQQQIAQQQIAQPLIAQPPIQPSTQPPLSEMTTTGESADAEKIKKQLEWELWTLEANDLRSHAWYHGNLADRNEAERLLRQCVVEEHGIKDVIAKSVGISSPDEGQGDGDSDSDSDGLEDVSSMSSENDFAVDDFLDGLVDENGMVPDPSTATSTAMAAALLVQQQRRRMNGVLPSKRPKRPHRHRRHFYCFLVRGSLNIRPPGRYVVSCLRVDNYDDDKNDTTNNFQSVSRNIGDERKRMKFRRRQYRRRLRRQQQHPVLHFVINEIILQPGTVYERSQFTFGDTLPTMASTISTNVSLNNNGQGQCQPGFDSVPDLIRYYVGGADDDAVLSYGGNDGMLSNSSMLPPTTHTEVRIRYPCNRRVPLTMPNSMTEITSKEFVPEVTERVKEVCQNPRALTTVTTLSGSLQIPPSSSMIQAESQMSSQNPLHQWHVPPPSFHSSNWKKVSSSFRSSTRRTPSATVTSATACKPNTTAESATKSSSSNPCKTHAPVPGLLPLSSIPLNIPSHLPITSVSSMGPPTLNPLGSSTTPSQGPSTKSSSSTLPLSSMDSHSKSSSSVNLPPSKTPKQPSSQLIISSPSGSLKLAQRSSISVSLNKPPPLQMESSPLKNFGTPDKSLKSFETPEFLHKPSTSGVNRSNAGNSDGPGKIDIDAEIAAALAVAADDDSDDELTSEFNAPEPIVVRSSFTRVNLDTGRRGKSRITQNRSVDNQNRFGTRPGGSMVNASTQGTGFPTINDHNNKYKREQKKLLSNFPSDPSLPLDPYDSVSALEYENTKKMEQLIKEIGDPVKRQKNLLELQNVILNLRREEEERVLEKWADAEMERLEWERIKKQNQDKKRKKNPPEPVEHEDFEVWRSRFTNSMKNKLENMSEESRQERLFQLRTQLIESRRNEIQQQRLLLKNLNLAECQASNTLTRHTNSDTRGILPEAGQSVRSTVICNRSDAAPATVQNRTAASEFDAARSSVRLSNYDIVETMINRWIGARRGVKSNVRDVTKTTIKHKTQMDIHMMQHRRRQNRNRTQINQGLTARQRVVDQQVGVANMISTSQSSTIMTLNGISSNLTTTMRLSTVNTSSMSTSVSKVENSSTGFGTVTGYNSAVCDYENIGSSNENITEYNSTAVDDDSVVVRDNNAACNNNPDKSTSYNKGNQNYCAAEAVDYENVVSRHVADSKNIDYANTGKHDEKQQNQNAEQILKYDDSGNGGAEVASALRAVHLAIIGDPEDGGKTVASTGRLAAALCRADGRTTVLPYRKCEESEIEEKVVGSILGTCPLQLLGQPGPAGRRARLDVIERFACLQYLVAMTVIVTPCLLLIGGSTNRSENECLEWSLEDEYEYRRRKFYYRCAGIGNSYFSGSNSDNDDDDDDDDAYQLSADSDFNAGYSLPPKEDWTTEKRHWLDLLNQHRAIALDKWIRTAADTKQAVGDVFGYRALMSALCSDRIQSLRDAWTTLRRLHTTTAVAFESRLRPEFLGRRDKHVSAAVIGETSQDLYEDDDDNEIDMLLQLPPNATVPDATALAVLYEHMYNDGDYDVGYNTSGANDNNSKEEKNSRPSSLFTSPLLLSPSPWSSLNSGISGGLGVSAAADYGLKALHALCIQYSDWVKQSYSKGLPMKSKSKSPMLPLDMFRNNFRALLRQYGGDDYDDNSHDGYDEEYYFHDNNQEDFMKKNFALLPNKSNIDEENNFEYERHYEDKVESYIASGGDYDECGDDDDDDATVICCSNSSIATKTVNSSPNITTADMVQKTMIEKKRQATTSDQRGNCRHQKINNREEHRWVKAAALYGQGPAPLNVVFRTELHVHLFWPSTLRLMDENDASSDNDNIDHQLYVPAYGLGTTHSSLAATNRYDTDKVRDYQRGVQSPTMLNDVIVKQLDRVTEDMRQRYRVMDKFLDGACAYSKEAAQSVSADPTSINKQKQFLVSK